MKTEKLEIITVPTQLKPVIDSSKIEVSKAQMHAIAFAPSMQDYLTIADNITGLNKVDPSETDAKIARENRLKLVKVRTGAEEIKDVRKEGIKAEGDLIQALFNVVKNSCIVTETEFLEIEKHQERKEKERQDNLSTERITLLSPFEYDTTYLPLGVMTNEQFEKVLDNAKLLFNTRKEKEEAVLLAQIEADKKAEEERIAREKADAEAREAQRIENERLKAEAAEREKEYHAKLQLEEDRFKDRLPQLEKLGFTWDAARGYFNSPFWGMYWETCVKQDDQEWADNIEQIKIAFKEGEEKERIAKSEREAAEKEQKRLADEAEKLRKENEAKLAKQKAEAEAETARLNKIAEQKLALERTEREKAEAELKAKRDAEAKIEADRLAALSAPDKEKINALYKTIKELDIPDFATKEAQAIGVTVRTRLNDLLAEIKELSKNLK